VTKQTKQNRKHFFLKISRLMVELETITKEKGETEEARKTAEEQIEFMKKEHAEKVRGLIQYFVITLSQNAGL